VSDARAGLLRVATLNLWGRFGDWPRRLATLVATWPRVDADVLLVQEAWTTPTLDQVQVTAEALGYPHTSRGAPSTDWRGGPDVETVAILSRVPLRDPDVTVLPASEPLRSRVTVTLDHPRRPLTVACGHTVFTPTALCHAQVRALCDLGSAPLVLGGDLNTRPAEVLPIAAEHGLADTLGGDEAPTWPVDAATFRHGWIAQVGEEPRFSLAPRRLDYILTRGLETVGAGVDPLRDPRSGAPASDHAAVWADLRP
jgi:endonuclease/exonuclease/phosphatase family metal-dependent hydrolase